MILDETAKALRPLTRSLRGGTSPDQVLAQRTAAERHGVLPLLARSALAATREPGAQATALKTILRDAAARYALLEREARRVTAALGEQGIRVLELKGAYFANALYDPPALRPFSDLDLLVAPADRGRACEHVRVLGYEPIVHVRGDAILAQAHFSRAESGMHYAIDLHWHALNPSLFREALPFERLWERSGVSPGGDRAGRGLSPPDAMLLAAAHLGVHHADAPRLIWLADVDRLAAKLSPAEWQAFVGAAQQARLCSATLPVLREAIDFFGTVVPEIVLRRLEAAAPREGFARSFVRQQRPFGRLWIELRSLGTWRARARLAREHLFPGREYMAHRQAVTGPVSLAWAYVRRALTGARKWSRKTSSSPDTGSSPPGPP